MKIVSWQFLYQCLENLKSVNCYLTYYYELIFFKSGHNGINYTIFSVNLKLYWHKSSDGVFLDLS